MRRAGRAADADARVASMLVGALRRFVAPVRAASAGSRRCSRSCSARSPARRLQRSISLGFYLVGCLLLIVGFFVGNRGPLRHDRKATRSPHSSPRPSARRRPTSARRRSSVSVLFIVIGLGLILLGVGVRTRPTSCSDARLR